LGAYLGAQQKGVLIMALTTQVGLEFIARNRANQQISSFNRSIARMGRQMLAIAGVGGGLYALKRGFDYITKAAMVQESAERELIAAVEGSITGFKAYAAEMQKLTIYGDEQILSQMAYAKNLGVTTDKLQEATTAAIGLAAQYRIDLASAMMLVGRASQGQTQMLTRYGIVIDQNLSTQDKFNELLKIGAESFNLAEEAAKTSEGTWTQFKNTIGDTAEELGGPFLDYITIALRKILELRGAVEKPISLPYPPLPKGWTAGLESPISEMEKYRGITEGQIKALKEYERLYEEAIRKGQAPPTFMYGGIESATSIVKEDPWAEMSKRLDETNLATQKAANTVRDKYLPVLQREIQITGRIGEAHYHAAKMVDFENAVKKAGLENTREGIQLIDEMTYKLKELEKAQQLARIADDIGSSFANAFEDMIFEAKKFDEVMRSVLRSIARSVMQNLIFQPMGLAISWAIRGGLSALFGNAGSTMAAEREPGYYGHKGIPADFMPRLHGGLKSDEFAAIIQRGEEIIPKADAGKGGGGDVVVNLIYKGLPMMIDHYEQEERENQRIINVFTDSVQQGGPAQHVIREVIANYSD